MKTTTMAYEITNVSSKEIEFKHKDRLVSIEIEDYQDYRKCSEFHFYNEQSNDMIVINNFYRLFFFDNETKQLYRRATQYDFDFWNTIHRPESDNSKVYHYVKKN